MKNHQDKAGAITPTTVSKRPETLGDRIRQVADRLNQETQIQIKATSRILGAAAQIAQNHDRLIDEVVDMVEEDLAQQENSYSVDRLKREFKSLNEAKSHFDIKANSWANLAEKLNQSKSAKPAVQQTKRSSKKSAETPAVNSADSAIGDRLDKIEAEMQILRADLVTVLEAIGRLEERVR